MEEGSVKLLLGSPHSTKFEPITIYTLSTQNALHRGSNVATKQVRFNLLVICLYTLKKGHIVYDEHVLDAPPNIHFRQDPHFEHYDPHGKDFDRNYRQLDPHGPSQYKTMSKSSFNTKDSTGKSVGKGTVSANSHSVVASSGSQVNSSSIKCFHCHDKGPIDYAGDEDDLDIDDEHVNVVHCVLSTVVDDDWKCTNIFHTFPKSGDRSCKLVIDTGSTMNVVAKNAIDRLKLKSPSLPQPKDIINTVLDDEFVTSSQGYRPIARASATVRNSFHCQSTRSKLELSYYEAYLDRCYDLIELRAKEIAALDDKDGQTHLKGLSRVPVNKPRVPYQESKLTRILQESLGETSHALLNLGEYQESVHTVSMAARSRRLSNVVSSTEKLETPKVKVDRESKLQAWFESKGKTRSIHRSEAYASPFPVSSIKQPYCQFTVKAKSLQFVAEHNREENSADSIENVLKSATQKPEYIEFLNIASREELLEIKGIGQKMAKCIVDLRETSPLNSLSDLEKLGLSSKQVKMKTSQLCPISKFEP
ncbi:hypothetical protein GH714_014125 [Hevea brasiliensis]|uniref:Kinesin motor domain-containing protein n=1 Tax=Hevea brasiliensis TaxID=3981 RepID=A0A6A6LRQ9_HEVBR|nr:hypothetical protein GH714_014125 [Hevea brasiliensis]